MTTTAVNKRHKSWTAYVNDPAYTKHNEHLFMSAFQIYLDRGGTRSRAINLIQNTVTIRGASKPYTPRVISQETVIERGRLEKIVKSKYLTASGISWSDVGWHELPAMAREGGIAAALLAAGPAHVPNDGRSVHAVLGAQKIDQIIERKTK